MAKLNGKTLCMTRAIIKERGWDFENQYLATLKPEDKALYQSITPDQWFDESPDEENNIAVNAARLLFPNQTNPLRKLGSATSKKIFNIFFRLALRIPGPIRALVAAPSYWQKILATGEISVDILEQNKVKINITNFDTIAMHNREIIYGAFEAIVEMAGGRQPEIMPVTSSEKNWEWVIQWS